MKKIMFDDKFYLTEAVLDGEKTMTRRVEKVYDKYSGMPLTSGDIANQYWDEKAKSIVVKTNPHYKIRLSPRYKIGEVVAVAQTYKDARIDPHYLMFAAVKERFSCVEKEIEAMDTKGWSNKMFVRADLMPHQIEITDVRLERITEISDQDCLREGVFKSYIGYYVRGLETRDWEKESHVEMDGRSYKLFTHPREAFKTLIDKECGKAIWLSDAYVYVYSFRLVK